MWLPERSTPGLLRLAFVWFPACVATWAGLSPGTGLGSLLFPSSAEEPDLSILLEQQGPWVFVAHVLGSIYFSLCQLILAPTVMCFGLKYVYGSCLSTHICSWDNKQQSCCFSENWVPLQIGFLLLCSKSLTRKCIDLKQLPALSPFFCESGGWPWLSWVFCFRTHRLQSGCWPVCILISGFTGVLVGRIQVLVLWDWAVGS